MPEGWCIGCGTADLFEARHFIAVLTCGSRSHLSRHGLCESSSDVVGAYALGDVLGLVHAGLEHLVVDACRWSQA